MLATVSMLTCKVREVNKVNMTPAASAAQHWEYWEADISTWLGQGSTRLKLSLVARARRRHVQPAVLCFWGRGGGGPCQHS